MKLRKIFRNVLLSLVLAGFLMSGNVVLAGDDDDDSKSSDTYNTFLPDSGKTNSVNNCELAIRDANKKLAEVKAAFIDGETINLNEKDFSNAEFLGCAIKTGNISLWMIPYYIRYILEFILSIAGLIAVGGIVYGGFVYLFAGISEEKDKGKKSITYGLVGMVITLIAYVAVNIVIRLLTS